MIQTCTATLIEAAPPLVLSLAWTLIGIVLGLSSNTLACMIKRQPDGAFKAIKTRLCACEVGTTFMSTASSQFLVGILLLGRIATGTFDFEGDIEGCVTMMFFVHLFCELGQFACSAIDALFDYVMPESKAPPWLDPAPYVQNGGVYGYAMLQYRVKKKSGHARPKHGGEQETLTSRSLTFWLGHASFHLALLATIIFCVISVVASARELWWCCPSDGDDDDDNDADKSSTSPVEQEEKAAPATPERHECENALTIADDEPKLFTMWLKPFHINFARIMPAYLQWRSHVDAAAMPSQFQDEGCAKFEVQTMIPWRLRDIRLPMAVGLVVGNTSKIDLIIGISKKEKIEL